MPVRDRSLSALLVLVLLLAFLLRVDGLSAQSLWYDEGFSVNLAGQSWQQIVFGELNLPPLYNLSLGAWVRAAGTSEFAVRYLSVCLGLLVVALGGVLGMLLLGRRVGALTALLLAVSPIEAWYAQEVRMYAALAALALASSALLLRLMRGERTRWLWVAYTLTNIAAVYVHYYAALALAAQAAWMLLYFLKERDGRLIRSWLVAQACLGIALLPWLPVFLGQWRAANTTYWPGTVSWQAIAWSTALGTMGDGAAVSRAAASRLVYLAGGLATLGLVMALWQKQARWGVLLLLVSVLVPFGVFYALVHTRPKLSPRYLLPVVPPLLTLAAAGLAGLYPRVTRHWHEWARAALAVVAGFALAAGSSQAATNPLRDGSFGRDDLRGAAQYLTGTVPADEAVLLLSGHLAPAFSYYYHRDNCYPIPANLPASPSPDDPVSLDVIDELSRALEGRTGAWLVLWQDEVVDSNRVVQTMLERVGKKEPVQRSFRGLRLEHYTFPAGARLRREDFGRQPLNVDIGQGDLQLLSCDPPSLTVPSGGTATVLLYWQAKRPISRDYRISIAVTDEQGQELAGAGGRLAAYMVPTDRWRPGALVMARHDIVLPKTLLPGEYTVVARIYPYGIPVGQTVSLGRLRVGRAPNPPALSELGIVPLLDVPMGTVQLLGSKLSPSEAMPGQTVYLTLFWKALARPVPGARAGLRLGEQPWADLPLPPAVAELEPGDIFSIQYPLTVPPAAARGSQAILLLPDGGGGQPAAQPVGVGALAVLVGERSFAVPASIRQPRHVDLGGKVTFLGYDLDTKAPLPGATLHLTLYWQAVQSMGTSYTVFAHLLDGQEKIWGQADSIPVQRTRPTTGWLPGEVLVDTYDIQVSRTAPPGEYVIEIGLYDPATGARLPAYDEAGQHLYADRILLDTIRIGAVGASPPANP